MRERDGPYAERSAWFETSADGVLLFSKDGRVSDANREACRVLGRPRESLLGLARGGVFDASDPRLSRALEERDRKGRFRGDLDLLRGEGSPFPAEVSLATWDGGFGVTFRDATGRDGEEREIRKLNTQLENRVANRTAQLQAFVAELQESEKALRESEERFRASFEQAAVGIAHVSLLSRWTKVNDRLCQILGYTKEEMLRLGFQEITHPEDLDADFGQFKEALSSKLRTYSIEKRYIRKDGRNVWVNQTLSVVRDASGRPAYFICVVEDVTDRKRAEESLRRSEEQFRSLVQNTSDIISVCDADGTILYQSPSVEKVLGFRPEEMVGKNAFDYVHPEDAKWILSLSQLARDAKFGQHMEFRFRHKDGSWRHLEVISDDLLGNPSVGGIIVSARDVTERKRTNEALRRSVDVLLALSEAGQILGSTLETEEIVTRLLTIMRRVSGLTAAVISVEDEPGQPRIYREVGLEGLWRRARYAPQAEEARRVVLDAGEHRLFRLRGPEGAGQLVGLYLPLRMKERIAGVLEAYGPESLAGEDAVEILRSLAAQAASALENARLYGELANREARLKELVGKLLNAQEEERRRVAYEVHDGLAQVAAAAHQHLQAFAAQHPPGSSAGQEMLDRGLELIRRTVGEARQVIADLRPTVLDDFGLETALRLQVEDLNAEGWQIDFSGALGTGRLPVAVETALYRVAQEALTNVRKHSGNSTASVELGCSGRSVWLRIEDQGKGFDPGNVPEAGGPGERVGLSSMRERIELVGGEFEMRSEEGVGTTIQVRVPVPDHIEIETIGYPTLPQDRR